MSQTTVAELEELRARMQQLVDAGLTDETRAEFDRLSAEFKSKAAEAERAAEDERRKKEVADIARFLERPAARLPMGDGYAEPQQVRKGLSRAGWECKGGMLFAPTSRGELVPLWTEEVVFGPLPDDPEAARYYRAVRRSLEESYAPLYVKALRLRGLYGEAAIAHLDETERKALAEGSDTAGGALVPADVLPEILSRISDTSVIRRYARVVNTSRDMVVWPRFQPASGSGGSIYSDGFIGSWVGETPTFADVGPSFGFFQIPVRKLRAATVLSNDLLADAAANVLAELTTRGARNLALVEDQGFITGAGTSFEPQGILNGGAATVDVEGTTANTISNTTTNAGSAPKLLDLVYAVPPQYRRGSCAWLMHPQTEKAIRKLVDSQNRFLFQPLVGSQFAGRPAPMTLEGYPVESSQFMPTDGTDGAKVLVFGELSSYIVVQRAQITTVVLRERFADTDQVGLILFERVGGALANEDAVRIGVV
ncbi:MAG TPA: phage major capsid protein [Candidatus Tectomicrobia bacterium]|nr:phage major capsid protein [Candidatus Tectomicrobia bacterium]